MRPELFTKKMETGEKMKTQKQECRLVVPNEVETLYQKHKTQIHRFLVRRGCAVSLAEDLTHDTFLKFLTRVQQGRVWHEFVPGLIYRMARDVLSEHIGRDRLAGGELPDIPAPAGRDDMRIRELCERCCRDPSLSERQRRVLALRALFGCSETEIAGRMKVSRNTVRKEWRAVSLHLHSAFENEGLDPREQSYHKELRL